jgi:glutaredoxin
MRDLQGGESMKRLRLLMIAIFILSLIACSKKAEKKTEPDFEEPPQIVVSKENKNLVFSYIDKDGNFKDTQNIDDIPEESRKQVIVFDLSIPPQKRQSHKIIYIADLTAPDANGRYRYTIASRYDFESALREGAISTTQGKSAGKNYNMPEVKITGSASTAQGQSSGSKWITIYTTSWCGVCAQLRRYLDQRKIKYTEKDIEKDEKAREEMIEKLRKKGLKGSGVPVIDIDGDIIVGFNKELLDSKIR